MIIYSFSYDGSFLIFFCVYVSPFYDVSFSYRLAYENVFFKKLIK